MRDVHLEPGFRLDRYELLSVLANGGMATVWLARLQGKHGFEKLVAIKTMLPIHAEDETFRQMFLDEARIASQIEHPNVAQILDLGEEHGVLYLVMELVDGDPLHKLLRACDQQSARVPLGIGLRIVADACAGLEAAHRLAAPDGTPLYVVHRDISPQNILVTTNGTAKLIDFGIAKARDRSAADTASGTFKGKIQYMPREQAVGSEVDQRTDLWSMGAVLYALCAGRPPYKDKSQFGTLQLLMNWAPIPPLPADVPAPVAALVMKALAHDPARRFQSAREMRDALDAAMVRCNLTTTPAHVAGFVSEHLRALSDARKRTIEQALSQATVRRASERPPSTLPYGGAMASSMPPPNTLRGVGGGGAAGSVAPPAPPIPTIALFGPAPPGVPLVGGAATNAAAQPIAPPPPAATAAHDAPAHLTQSQVSQMNGTLARAATTSSTFDERPPFMPPRRSRIVAIGVAAVAAVGLVVAGAIGELGRGGAGAGAAGSLAAHAASTAGETAAANATATAAPAATTATTTAMAGAAAATAPAAAMGGGAVSPAQTAAAMETSGRGHGASSSHHATTRGAAARTTAAAPPAMQTAAPPAPKPASPSGKSGDDDLGF